MTHRIQRSIQILAALSLIVLLLAAPSLVSAHQNITVGAYTLEYGWLNEPAVAGQQNAVVINISGGPDAAVDMSQLKVEAVYGGQTKTLTLQPLSEDAPGQFIAPITPTRPGVYTLRLSGKIASTAVQVEVQPEEVQPLDTLQFPRLETTAPAANALGLGGWLGLGGLLLGLAGVILGMAALTKKTR